MNNLFICLTPLQLKICALITSKNSESGDLILIRLSRSKIYDSYLKKYNSLFKNIKILTPSPRNPIIETLKLRQALNNKKYTNVYVASINSLLVQFLLSIINPKKIFTYDDGNANVLKSSDYYVENITVKKYLKKMIYYFLGNRFSLKDIIRASKCHYTIFENLPNINDKKVFISILPKCKFKKKIDKTAVVLIGLVFSEDLNIKVNKYSFLHNLQFFLQKKFTANNVKFFYIPHPREEQNTLKGFIQLSNKISSEDHIAKLKCLYKRTILIGFGGTTQFLFFNDPMIKNIFIRSPDVRYIGDDAMRCMKNNNMEILNLAN